MPAADWSLGTSSLTVRESFFLVYDRFSPGMQLDHSKFSDDKEPHRQISLHDKRLPIPNIL